MLTTWYNIDYKVVAVCYSHISFLQMHHDNPFLSCIGSGKMCHSLSTDSDSDSESLEVLLTQLDFSNART